MASKAIELMRFAIGFLICVSCASNAPAPKMDPAPPAAPSVKKLAVPSEPPPDLFAPSRPTRALRVPAACVGAKLDYATATATCACATGAIAAITKAPEVRCDFEQADGTDMNQLQTAAEIVAGSTADSPTRVLVRFTNPTDRPLRVLLDRGHDTFEPTLLDEHGKEMALERDRNCKEVDSVAQAHVALVVIEPGGRLEHTVSWLPAQSRRVPAGANELGCKTAPGAKLRKGKYTVVWAPAEVWAFRTASLRVPFEVR